MYLRPDVHVAKIGQDIVLLDAGGGEYLCLPDAAEAFELTLAAPPRILDASLAAEARALGLVGTGQRNALALPRAPASDIPGERPSLSEAADLVGCLSVFTTLVGRYYGRPFPQLVTYAARTRREAAAANVTPQLIDQVLAFRRLLPWAPFQGVCLYRSFSLLAFLRRRGLDATWVFGVRTWPFEAHCWLQVGDVVLDDTSDHVRPFTPIMAV